MRAVVRLSALCLLLAAIGGCACGPSCCYGPTYAACGACSPACVAAEVGHHTDDLGQGLGLEVDYLAREIAGGLDQARSAWRPRPYCPPPF